MSGSPVRLQYWTVLVLPADAGVAGEVQIVYNAYSSRSHRIETRYVTG